MKEYLVKILDGYNERIKQIMNDMEKVYSAVEHLRQSLDIVTEELKKGGEENG